MIEARPAARAVLRLLEREGRLQGGDVARVTELAAKTDLGIHALLEREGVITETALAALFADRLHLRLIDAASVPLDRRATEVLRESVATQHEVVPVRLDEGMLEVATANPLDLEAMKAVEFATGRRLRPVVATRTGVMKALGRAFRGEEAAVECPPPPSEEPREASAPREPLALDELRALIAQIRGEQHAALAETNAATAEARAIAEKALVRVDTVAADDPGVALEHVAAAVASLRDQVAELQRRQEEHAVAAANASAEATSARETAAEAVRRIEEVGRPRAEVASVEAAVARLSAELDGLRSAVEEAAASRPIEDPAAPAEAQRARLDELALAQKGDRELASRAAADAARAMRQAEKAIMRIADAIDPLGDELRALRSGFGELRGAQTRHEAAVERRLTGAETRTESSLTSLSERIDHLGHKLDAQEMAGENTRVEAALTRQRAAEALHGVEALESLRVELAALESRVEEQIEASIRMETARLATETGLRDRLEAEAQGLREGFETLAARLREVTGETRWLPTVNQLFDRLATLTEVPSRALTRLVALLGW